MRKEEQIAEKIINDYSLPSGFTVDNISAEVYEAEFRDGVYKGYEKKYGVELVFRDDMLDGGEYRYEETVPVNRIEAGKIKALYLEKIKHVEVFDSVREMIFHHLQTAETEVQDKMTAPEHDNVDADNVEDRAQAALDSIEEMEKISD